MHNISANATRKELSKPHRTIPHLVDTWTDGWMDGQTKSAKYLQ